MKTTSGAIVAGAALTVIPDETCAHRKFPIGIQLFTVRQMMSKDVEATLRDVAAAGYQEVETAGYFGKTAADFKKAVEDAGLKCVSAHHPGAALMDKTDEIVQYCHDLGVKYLICASPRAKEGEGKELTLDDWKWNAEQFNKMGEKAKAAGMQFGYHNHVRELRKLDGVLAYDELLRLTDPKLVTMEMDCGWFVVAGYHPTEYLKKYPDRFTLLHVKDVVVNKQEPEKSLSTEMGRGNIDYRPIFAAAKSLQHYFIEQEEFNVPVLDAIKIDAEYVRKRKF